MNKKQVLYLTMIIVVIIFTSCSGSGKVEYSAPSTSQVNEFISKNSVNALSIKEANDFTIVLFENGQEQGHYVLYKNQNNELISSSVKGVGNLRENPVSVGGVASGKTPFVTVIFNDEDMLLNAKEIEITFKDGNVVKEMISGKGTIVLHANEANKEPVTYTKLVIYDKAMKKLYEK